MPPHEKLEGGREGVKAKPENALLAFSNLTEMVPMVMIRDAQKNRLPCTAKLHFCPNLPRKNLFLPHKISESPVRALFKQS